MRETFTAYLFPTKPFTKTMQSRFSAVICIVNTIIERAKKPKLLRIIFTNGDEAAFSLPSPPASSTDPNHSSDSDSSLQVARLSTPVPLLSDNGTTLSNESVQLTATQRDDGVTPANFSLMPLRPASPAMSSDSDISLNNPIAEHGLWHKLKAELMVREAKAVDRDWVESEREGRWIQEVRVLY